VKNNQSVKKNKKIKKNFKPPQIPLDEKSEACYIAISIL
jgi:hypothetical protein